MWDIFWIFDKKGLENIGRISISNSIILITLWKSCLDYIGNFSIAGSSNSNDSTQVVLVWFSISLQISPEAFSDDKKECKAVGSFLKHGLHKQLGIIAAECMSSAFYTHSFYLIQDILSWGLSKLKNYEDVQWYFFLP